MIAIWPYRKAHPAKSCLHVVLLLDDTRTSVGLDFEVYRIGEMNAQKRKRRLDPANILAWAIMIAIPLWFVYSMRPRDGVYVGDDGRPNCLWGRLYCAVQSKRFYRSQLVAIDQSIAFQRQILPLMSAAEAQVAEEIKKFDVDGVRAKILNQYPQLRPAQAELDEQSQKRQADEVQATESRRILGTLIDAEVQKLKAKRRSVERMLDAK
jgi:hypothetical protein